MNCKAPVERWDCGHKAVLKLQGNYGTYWLCLNHAREMPTATVLDLADRRTYVVNPALIMALLRKEPINWSNYDHLEESISWRG